MKRNGAALNRSYHLKDHLGSVRVTVGATMVVENFSSDLSQWTTVLGSGYATESGELSASSGGGDNVLVNGSSTQIADGTIDVDVKLASGTSGDPSLIVRYVDMNNYYMVSPYWNMLTIYKKASGTYNLIQTVSLPGGTMTVGSWYHVQIALDGSTLRVFWNGQQLVSWTDPSSPFLTGKVGFRQCVSRHVHWDNLVAYATGTGAATVVACDDYYPFGQSMDLRCWNNGYGDARYKFTEKERDAETGYDYFGVRYYDARVGRWLSTEPLAEKYSDLSPYVYVGNNPWRNVDADGKDFGDFVKGVVVSVAQSVNPTYEAPPVRSVSGDQTDYAAGRVVGDVLGMAIGTAEVGAGSAGTTVGIAVSGTGVGAVVGVPTAVASAAVAGHGAMTSVVAASNLGSDVKVLMNQKSGSLQQEPQGGQTYNGRPTDKHGNVLGGSGEPRQYTQQHSTLKAAKDAARNEGKGSPIKHTKPTKGTSHFHPSDETGKKIPNSTHHEYPQ